MTTFPFLRRTPIMCPLFLAITALAVAMACHPASAQTLPQFVTSFENTSEFNATTTVDADTSTTITYSSTSVSHSILDKTITSSLADPPTPSVTDGNKALGVTFPASTTSSVTFAPSSGAWNWSSTPILAMEIHNPGTSAVTFKISVTDTYLNVRAGTYTIPQNSSVTIAAHLTGGSLSPYDYAKAAIYLANVSPATTIHTETIKQVNISVQTPSASSQELDIDDVVAVPAISLFRTFETMSDINSAAYTNAYQSQLLLGTNNVLEITQDGTKSGIPAVVNPLIAKWSAPTGSPWNWTATPVFLFDAANYGATTGVTLFFEISDGTSTQKFQIDLPDLNGPHSLTSYAVAFGGGYIPSLDKTIVVMPQVGTTLIDPSKVTSYQISATASTTGSTVIVDNFRMVPSSRMVGSFETGTGLVGTDAPTVAYIPNDVTHISTTSGTPGTGATNGNHALHLVFPASTDPYEAVLWTPQTVANPTAPDWDWRGTKALAFEARNPGTQPVKLYVRVDDSLAYKSVGTESYSPTYIGSHDYQGMATIPSDGVSHSYVFYLTPAQSSSSIYGVRNPPNAPVGLGPYDPMTTLSVGPAVTALTIAQPPAFVNTTLDFGKIHRVLVSVNQAIGNGTTSNINQELYFDNFRLIPSRTDESWYKNIVDQFGQYNLYEWEGKIHNLSDLISQLSSEDVSPHPTNRDTYGGWTFDSTSGNFHINPSTMFGIFQTALANNKWWLVDPSGNPFWSIGMNAVTYSQTPSFTGYNSANTAVAKQVRYQSFASALPSVASALPTGVYGSASTKVGPFKNLTVSPPPPATQIPPDTYGTYNFYLANLYQKYGNGTGYDSNWRTQTQKRLYSWGFNTIGRISDATIENGPGVDFGSGTPQRTPYMESLSPQYPTGFKKIDLTTIGNYNDTDGPMPDPYDPYFQPSFLISQMRSDPAIPLNPDPYCVGYFVDNELSWAGAGTTANDHYAIVLAILAGDDTNAKDTFVNQLVGNYPDTNDTNGNVQVGSGFTAFKSEWGTLFDLSFITTWSAVKTSSVVLQTNPTTHKTLQLVAGSPMCQKMETFLDNFANAYFMGIRNALHRDIDAHFTSWQNRGLAYPLYLGCRFHSWTKSAIKAAGAYCDVVSFNLYLPSFDATSYNNLIPGQSTTLGTQLWSLFSGLDPDTSAQLFNKPMMISEFSFGSPNVGLFGGNETYSEASSQSDRALKYQTYIQAIMQNPAFVGAHWYDYVDDPLLGRTFDGENLNMGFVSGTDTPYLPMVNAARSINTKVYGLHSGGHTGQP